MQLPRPPPPTSSPTTKMKNHKKKLYKRKQLNASRHQNKPTTTLFALPSELFLEIADQLDTAKDLSSLIRTNRFFASLLTKLLHRIAIKDHDGKTALAWAALEGHEPLARLLIEKGANVNEQDRNGRISLHHAALEGHEDVAELLLENGAEVDTPETDGMTALHWAAFRGSVGVVDILLDYKADITIEALSGLPLHWAAGNGQKKVVEALLANGAGVDSRNENGATALHWAVQAEHAETVGVLLASGADTNVVEDDGATALHLGAEGDRGPDRDSIVRMLISYGADVFAKDSRGNDGFIAAQCMRSTNPESILDSVYMLLLGTDCLFHSFHCCE